MDFRITKPTHVFAFLCVCGSLFLFVLLPILSVFFPLNITSVYSESMSDAMRLALEVFLVLFQFGFVFIFLILVPILWYVLVNHSSLREVWARLQLRRDNLSTALVWSVIAIVVAFAVSIAIGVLYSYLMNVNAEDLSNIPDLQTMFSTPSLYLIVIIQPFCEEFFFRGFLLDKITTMSTPVIGILLTSILFGISHLTYTYAYTAVIAMFLGLIFAVLVVKTKNLYAAIFAHTVLNVTSLTLYFLGKSLGF
ncbi:MAG: CPBP family intramembrane metalloprotease [Candidatus Thermoplasmatota archaeon]|nr:CPBP family intramembrane metalloprotease [Candidatus Thermoplasmatota archaeon]